MTCHERLEIHDYERVAHWPYGSEVKRQHLSFSCGQRVTSGPVSGAESAFTSEFRPHSREVEFLYLGIAKLLLQVVHVKRETLQVVSLAMTGLMRDGGRVFHS